MSSIRIEDLEDLQSLAWKDWKVASDREKELMLAQVWSLKKHKRPPVFTRMLEEAGSAFDAWCAVFNLCLYHIIITEDTACLDILAHKFPQNINKKVIRDSVYQGKPTILRHALDAPWKSVREMFPSASHAFGCMDCCRREEDVRLLAQHIPLEQRVEMALMLAQGSRFQQLDTAASVWDDETCAEIVQQIEDSPTLAHVLENSSLNKNIIPCLFSHHERMVLRTHVSEPTRTKASPKM